MRMPRRVIANARRKARLPWIVIYHYNVPVNHEPTMKQTHNSRGPRPGSIARVAGIDYADLDEHFGYAL